MDNENLQQFDNPRGEAPPPYAAVVDANDNEEGIRQRQPVQQHHPPRGNAEKPPLHLLTVNRKNEKFYKYSCFLVFFLLFFIFLACFVLYEQNQILEMKLIKCHNSSSQLEKAVKGHKKLSSDCEKQLKEYDELSSLCEQDLESCRNSSVCEKKYDKSSSLCEQDLERCHNNVSLCEKEVQSHKKSSYGCEKQLEKCDSSSSQCKEELDKMRTERDRNYAILKKKIENCSNDFLICIILLFGICICCCCVNVRQRRATKAAERMSIQIQERHVQRQHVQQSVVLRHNHQQT